MKWSWKKIYIPKSWTEKTLVRFKWFRSRERSGYRFVLDIDRDEMASIVYDYPPDVKAYIDGLSGSESLTPISDSLLRLQTLVYHLERREGDARRKKTLEILNVVLTPDALNGNAEGEAPL